MTDDSPAPTFPFAHLIESSEVESGSPLNVSLRPDDEARASIAGYLDIRGVSKLRFTADFERQMDGSIAMTGTLGATVTQTCVVTLGPVRTRIDEPVERLFVRAVPDTDEEHQMAEDEDEIEILRPTIDVGAIMVEELALALPPFPRASDAKLDQSAFAEPGVKPLSDDDVKPFAALAELRQKMKGD